MEKNLSLYISDHLTEFCLLLLHPKCVCCGGHKSGIKTVDTELELHRSLHETCRIFEQY